MTVRAVIFDVYGTLLDVRPVAAAAAGEGWASLWRTILNAEPRLTREEFGRATAVLIGREHAAARARGVVFPEVDWPGLVTEVLPELEPLGEAAQDAFIQGHAGLMHAVRLAEGAAGLLVRLRETGIELGIASNAQRYTQRELELALGQVGLARPLFDPALCFWSFEHGFSKPNPQVFRRLTAALADRGIGPTGILMVGDRVDNDIEPARAQGWRTWHRAAGDAIVPPGGSLPELARWLDRAPPWLGVGA